MDVQPEKLVAELTSEASTELKLQLPFAVVGCNEGTAGFTWVKLEKKSNERLSV